MACRTGSAQTGRGREEAHAKVADLDVAGRRGKMLAGLRSRWRSLRPWWQCARAEHICQVYLVTSASEKRCPICLRRAMSEPRSPPLAHSMTMQRLADSVRVACVTNESWYAMMCGCLSAWRTRTSFMLAFCSLSGRPLSETSFMTSVEAVRLSRPSHTTPKVPRPISRVFWYWRRWRSAVGVGRTGGMLLDESFESSACGRSEGVDCDRVGPVRRVKRRRVTRSRALRGYRLPRLEGVRDGALRCGGIGLHLVGKFGGHLS